MVGSWFTIKQQFWLPGCVIEFDEHADNEDDDKDEHEQCYDFGQEVEVAVVGFEVRRPLRLALAVVGRDQLGEGQPLRQRQHVTAVRVVQVDERVAVVEAAVDHFSTAAF